MSAFRIQDAAGRRLDEIYSYTRRRWGEAQAQKYIRGFFDKFKAIAARRCPWRAIPAEFGVDGFYCRHERHVIYWKLLDDGSVGIATILHERMHQIERIKDDLKS
ncbi:MAG: type II toxin-antitoxin system RelE/ParE family toxin [Alphaproteobacteria bacterium]|nr:type II toxin-antitoxin system RelE/ParE family toxin [Alphaproteobacteria bacterium]